MITIIHELCECVCVCVRMCVCVHVRACACVCARVSQTKMSLSCSVNNISFLLQCTVQRFVPEGKSSYVNDKQVKHIETASKWILLDQR